MLPQLIGPTAAKEMIFTAKRFKGSEVVGLGLVNGVVEDPVAEALGAADAIAANAPLGVRGAKTVIEATANGGWAAGLELSRLLRPKLTDTDDHREALKAFAEKRAPHFQGK
uniref:Enoyl-CoA hydratase n=2 Tax=Phaeomonas parva TaxID=124430 RepID=A0A7S1XQX2_9STRA|mmetsp:Transcript_25546/g.79967  ORF Transcript_25546/g.79967 Transcript_25546/m.79967 type:complete len:112 (+) Transcript_25546:119-454(+)